MFLDMPCLKSKALPIQQAHEHGRVLPGLRAHLIGQAPAFEDTDLHRLESFRVANI